jgi:hypothetical protein
MAILWVSLVSFASTTLWVASQRVFIAVSVYFVIDSVRKLLYTPSYLSYQNFKHDYSVPESRLYRIFSRRITWIFVMILFLKHNTIRIIKIRAAATGYTSAFGSKERAGTAQWYSAGLRPRWSGVRVPVGARSLSPHQTGSGAHSASYSIGTRDCFPGGKAVEASCSSITSI